MLNERVANIMLIPKVDLLLYSNLVELWANRCSSLLGLISTGNLINMTM